MFKWLGRLFLFGLVMLLVLGIFAYYWLKGTQPPNIEDAPYALQGYYEDRGLKFPTRIYYAESIEFVDGEAVMTNYWTYDGERYKKHSGERRVSPPYSIVRRVR